MNTNRRYRVGAGLLLVLLSGAVACSSVAPGIPDGGADRPQGDGDTNSGGVTQSFVILHTNDLHSYLMGFAPEMDYTPASANDDSTVGGLARLAAKVAVERAAAGSSPVLLLDSGDFMMGTAFQILATGAAAELMQMGKLGYDATTIGNHELDWTPAGLAAILKAATNQGFAVPIVATNMAFSATDPGDDDLEKFTTAGLIRTKLVKNIGQLKVGILGLLGQNASLVSGVKAPLTFSEIAVAAAAAVTELRQTDKVDVVIALSHSGIDPMGQGEDRTLADNASVNAAGGIDVIISGHTHDALPTPFHTGKTWIVQAGSYGRYLGKMLLTATKAASGTSLSVDQYQLLPLDDSVPGDTATQAVVDGYIGAIDTLLAPAGLSYKQVVGESSVDIGAVAYAESGLGDLVTDAYLTVTKGLQPSAPPVIAIDAAGDLRADIKAGKTGKQWFADLFRVQPLGIGPTDQKPGYPLVTFYVNAQDIVAGLELSAASKTLNSADYLLQLSGLTATWQASAPLFHRVTDIKIGDTTIDLNDATTCYKAVTNIYVAGLLGLVKNLMGGTRAVVPKAEDCKTEIADLRTRIVDANPLTSEIEELKEWQALVGFVSKQPDTNGNAIPDIPTRYGAPAVPPRIVIVP
jgi:5'-nucleotidase/UDP-sugar diphosphatase